MILDLIALDNSSRVWIYQADRDLTYDELDWAREEIDKFLGSWTSHNRELDTYANVFHRRFLAIFVDESKSHNASGCSIDSSVHFVRQIGNHLNIDFFNRNLYGYFENEDIHIVTLDQFKELLQAQTITQDTLVFDNLVKTKGDFLQKWIIPLQNSWINRLI